MNFIIARMREPSTWAGLAMLVSMGSHALDTGDTAAIGAVVGGLIAIFLPEKGPK